MKIKNLIYQLLTVVLSLVLQVALVLADESKKTGYFGNLILGSAVTTRYPSQLEVTDNNKQINGYEDHADSDSEATPLAMAEIGYAIESTGTEITMGNQPDPDSISLTLNQSMGNLGSMKLLVDYRQIDVWQDPYLLGVGRKATKETIVGCTLNYESILNTGAILTLGAKNHEIDEDKIGTRLSNLRRNGLQWEFGAGYIFELDQRQAIIPSVAALVDERDGVCESSKGYNIQIAHILSLVKWNFEMTVFYGAKQFDDVHPILNKTREENQYGFNELVTYIEPFGFRGYSIHGLVAYGVVDSNIAFFENNALVVALGIGYSVNY